MAIPVVLPDTYSGSSSWEEWITHFENISAVNEWTGDQKLQWLKVRLTSRAQTAFQRLAGETQQSYERAKAALQERFEPKSRQSRYQAEFQTRRKKRSETWADFADDLKLLVDRGFPELEDPARECLAVHTYLQQLDEPQVAFSVRQKRPKTLEEAGTATLEMESYLSATKPQTVSTVHEGEEDAATVAAASPSMRITELLERLIERVERLERERYSPESAREGLSKIREPESVRSKPLQLHRGRSFGGTCWECGQRGHAARNCPRGSTSQQGN